MTQRPNAKHRGPSDTRAPGARHRLASRRGFLIGSASALGGLSLGFHVPLTRAQSSSDSAEVNAWVLVRPDEHIAAMAPYSPGIAERLYRQVTGRDAPKNA